MNCSSCGSPTNNDALFFCKTCGYCYCPNCTQNNIGYDNICFGCAYEEMEVWDEYNDNNGW